jgi:two-component system, chemotaxis family, chemotaxis protein CheY
MAVIMVVDDDSIGQRMLGYTLQKNGHRVVQAMNGVQALERLAETAVDLIITDLNMPEMDGPTLLKQLRADDRYKDLPIVMLTASGQDHDRVEARAAGATDFLTKPTSSRELIETVSRILA